MGNSSSNIKIETALLSSGKMAACSISREGRDLEADGK